MTGERYARVDELGKGKLGFMQPETARFALGATDGLRMTDFAYAVLEPAKDPHKTTAQKLGALREGHRVTAYAWLDPGFVCLDDEGNEL